MFERVILTYELCSLVKPGQKFCVCVVVYWNLHVSEAGREVVWEPGDVEHGRDPVLFQHRLPGRMDVAAEVEMGKQLHRCATFVRRPAGIGRATSP